MPVSLWPSLQTANKQLLHDLTECEKLAEDERDALQQTLHATRTEKERVSGRYRCLNLRGTSPARLGGIPCDKLVSAARAAGAPYDKLVSPGCSIIAGRAGGCYSVSPCDHVAVQVEIFLLCIFRPGKGCRPNFHGNTMCNTTHFSKPKQEVGALGATIKKRREELQEVTHTNTVEMDSIKTKAAEAVAKAKEDHEKKVRAFVSWGDELNFLIPSARNRVSPLRYFQDAQESDALGTSFLTPNVVVFGVFARVQRDHASSIQYCLDGVELSAIKVQSVVIFCGR